MTVELILIENVVFNLRISQSIVAGRHPLLAQRGVVPLRDQLQLLGIDVPLW